LEKEKENVEMCGIWISNESTDTTNSKHALMYHWDAEVG